MWIGDPNGHQPMQNVPEFNDENRDACRAACTRRRSGRRTCNRPTSSSRSRTGRAAAGRRAPARLFLPGNECLYQITGYGGGRPPCPARVRRARAGAAAADHRRAAAAAPAQPVQTVPVRPVYAQVDAGTTIPPNNLDANAPVPSVLVSQGLAVRGC